MLDTALRFNATATGPSSAFDAPVDLPAAAARGRLPVTSQASVAANTALLQTSGVLIAGWPNPLNNLPVENRVQQVRGVLDSKNLAGSFVAHLKDQLHRNGVIRIGVVDDFSAGQTHGLNVEARILANVPSYLKDRVRIIRFDMGGQDRAGRARMLQRAAAAAQPRWCCRHSRPA